MQAALGAAWQSGTSGRATPACSGGHAACQRATRQAHWLRAVLWRLARACQAPSAVAVGLQPLAPSCRCAQARQAPVHGVQGCQARHERVRGRGLDVLAGCAQAAADSERALHSAHRAAGRRPGDQAGAACTHLSRRSARAACAHLWAAAVSNSSSPQPQNPLSCGDLQEERDKQLQRQKKFDIVEGNPERVFLVGIDLKRCGVAPHSCGRATALPVDHPGVPDPGAPA